MYSGGELQIQIQPQVKIRIQINTGNEFGVERGISLIRFGSFSRQDKKAAFKNSTHSFWRLTSLSLG